jgi:pimeloyl-ACP methyl ester carboxylesterase
VRERVRQFFHVRGAAGGLALGFPLGRLVRPQVAQGAVGGVLYESLKGTDLRQRVPALDVPVVMIMGRQDLFTPYRLARGYFDALRAPQKRFVSFERSAHFVMLEEPGRFLTTLVTAVLPLTEGSPTFSPDQ